MEENDKDDGGRVVCEDGEENEILGFVSDDEEGRDCLYLDWGSDFVFWDLTLSHPECGPQSCSHLLQRPQLFHSLEILIVTIFKTNLVKVTCISPTEGCQDGLLYMRREGGLTPGPHVLRSVLALRFFLALKSPLALRSPRALKSPTPQPS